MLMRGSGEIRNGILCWCPWKSTPMSSGMQTRCMSIPMPVDFPAAVCEKGHVCISVDSESASEEEADSATDPEEE